MRYYWAHVYFVNADGSNVDGGYHKGQWHIRLVVPADSEEHAEHLASLVASQGLADGTADYRIEVGPCQ